MEPFMIPIVAISVGGVLAITYMVLDFVAKIQKSKTEAQNRGVMVEELTVKLDKLKTHNQSLQKRIENLEAIVVDRDMEGLHSEFSSQHDMDTVEEPGYGKKKNQDVQY